MTALGVLLLFTGGTILHSDHQSTHPDGFAQLLGIVVLILGTVALAAACFGATTPGDL